MIKDDEKEKGETIISS